MEVDQRKNATPDTTDFSIKYAYDFNHQLTVTTDPLGYTVKSEYDRDGNEVATTDQENNRTILTLDQRGDLLAQKVPYTSVNGIITYRTTAFEYDEVGNQTRVISPRGVDTTDDPDDFAAVSVYDAVNQVVEEWQPYDRDDARYTTPDKVLYTYDPVGNVSTISAPPSEGQTQRAVTTNTYFDNGWNRTSTDPWNVRTEYDYDALGGQTSRKLVGAGGATRTVNWTYYPDGKKKTQSDDGAASSTARKNFEFLYDPNANIEQMLDKSTDAKIDKYQVFYDKVNRVAKVEELVASTLKNTTSFEYDLNDNVLKRTHDRQLSEYTYDARDLPSLVKNRKSASDTSPKTVSFEYTPRRQPSKETKANGNVVTSEYYLDQTLRHELEKKSNGTTVNEHTIEYDANGNQSKDVAHKQNADNKSAYLDTTTTYEYDPRDRIRKLTKTGYAAGTETYVHDANSNVITQTVGGTTTTFNYDRDRLISSSTAGVGSTYEYDAWGRLTRVVAGGMELEKYTYDGFDHTVEHRKSGTSTTTFKYDPLDRQVQRTQNGKTTDLIYLGLTDSVLAEEEGGKVKKTYQYGPDGQLLSQEKVKDDGSQETSNHGYNSHSDVEQVTDEQGDSRATYGYTAYGKNDNQQFTGIDKPDPTNPEDPNKEPYNAYRFNGKRFDQATGDYDMGFRDYDPGLNRFLARDAYNGALADLNLSTDPFTQNRYAFAGGNPISNVELDGHFSLSDIGHAALDVAGLVPGVGEVADLANAAWYAAEGDYANAALSAASAIPFAGYAASAAKGAKYAAKGIDAAKSATKAADSAKSAGKIADTAQGAGKTAPSPAKATSGAGGPTPARAVDSGPRGAAKPASGGSGARPSKAAGGGGPGKASGGGAARGADCNSFVPGTPVLMGDGSHKAIETVELGDRVVATDPETGRTEGRPVTALIIGNGYKHLVEISVRSTGQTDDATQTVVATGGHPFWVASEQIWRNAEDLRIGQLLRTSAGTYVQITAVRSWYQQQRVHNLTVADIHTYYVSAASQDLLVHNTGPCGVTLLGKWKGAYKGDPNALQNFAGRPGYNVLSRPAKGAGKWRWNRNKQFVDEALERGDEIRLMQDPANYRFTGGIYKKELKYLRKLNYDWRRSGSYWVVFKKP